MKQKRRNIEKMGEGTYALILTKTNNILLQRRNLNSNIENPGKIAMFGGAIEDGEKLLDGLKRELFEELELNIEEYQIKKLNTYQKTQELDGINHSVNVWLIYDVERDDLVLHEGHKIISSKPKDIVNNKKLSRITKLAIKDLLIKKL